MLENVKKVIEKQKRISERIERELSIGSIPTLTLSRDELENRMRNSRMRGNC